MIRQSRLNRSSSFNSSEFHKSLALKLDSLCDSEPTFDSMGSSVRGSSPLSDSSSKGSRRRRLYHSPGVVGRLHSPGMSIAQTERQETVLSIGSVLAERAKLVRKALTRNTAATRNCSTPLRGSFENISVNITQQQNEKVTFELSEDAECFHTAQSELDSRRRQSSETSSYGTPSRKLRKLKNSSSGPTLSSSGKSEYSRILDLSILNGSVADSISLDQFKFKSRKGRKPKELAWIVQACTLIRHVVNTGAGTVEEISKCRCLQLLLVVSKDIETAKTPGGWFGGFQRKMIEASTDMKSCTVHKRYVRDLDNNIKNYDLKKAQNVIDETTWSSLSEWIRNSRPLLLERLASNIHKLA